MAPEPAPQPAAETAPHAEPAAAEPPPSAPPLPAVVRLARVGALALLAALLIPLVAEAPDRWNVFAVLSPFEVIGVAVVTWLLARAPTEVAAGALIGFGALTVVASLGLLRFTAERLGGLETLLAVVTLFGAGAILAAGVRALRSSQPGPAAAGADPGPLVLGLAGIALACVALIVDYDGFSSLWDELLEGESAEFFFEPAVAAAAALAGLVLLGARPRLAAGLLLAVGTATTLHYAGLIVAAWRAIGEVGEIRGAGYIGLLAGLLILAAGALARSSSRAAR